jgi:hypothetical protein
MSKEQAHKTVDVITDERLASLLSRSRATGDQSAHEAILDELLQIYEEEVAAGNPAAEVRRAFLLALQQAPSSVDDERFSRFLTQEVEPSDFAKIRWQNPNQVIVFCELMYGFQSPDEAVVGRVRNHVRHLLGQALQQFEQQGEMEKVFLLLRLAPTTPDMMRDAELLRLRNRAHLYEMRRVQRNRRILYSFLLLQLVFIVVVFPLLFVNAENGAIQALIEETGGVDLPEEPVQPFLGYLDGLYWSLITATSIGYGDITPITTIGRIIAAALGVMGVITTGLIAGLILSLIVPRALD